MENKDKSKPPQPHKKDPTSTRQSQTHVDNSANGGHNIPPSDKKKNIATDNTSKPPSSQTPPVSYLDAARKAEVPTQGVGTTNPSSSKTPAQGSQTPSLGANSRAAVGESNSSISEKPKQVKFSIGRSNSVGWGDYLHGSQTRVGPGINQVFVARPVPKRDSMGNVVLDSKGNKVMRSDYKARLFRAEKFLKPAGHTRMEGKKGKYEPAHLTKGGSEPEAAKSSGKDGTRGKGKSGRKGKGKRGKGGSKDEAENVSGGRAVYVSVGFDRHDEDSRRTSLSGFNKDHVEYFARDVNVLRHKDDPYIKAEVEKRMEKKLTMAEVKKMKMENSSFSKSVAISGDMAHELLLRTQPQDKKHYKLYEKTFNSFDRPNKETGKIETRTKSIIMTEGGRGELFRHVEASDKWLSQTSDPTQGVNAIGIHETAIEKVNKGHTLCETRTEVRERSNLHDMREHRGAFEREGPALESTTQNLRKRPAVEIRKAQYGGEALPVVLHPPAPLPTIYSSRKYTIAHMGSYVQPKNVKPRNVEPSSQVKDNGVGQKNIQAAPDVKQ